MFCSLNAQWAKRTLLLRELVRYGHKFKMSILEKTTANYYKHWRIAIAQPNSAPAFWNMSRWLQRRISAQPERTPLDDVHSGTLAHREVRRNQEKVNPDWSWSAKPSGTTSETFPFLTYRSITLNRSSSSSWILFLTTPINASVSLTNCSGLSWIDKEVGHRSL